MKPSWLTWQITWRSTLRILLLGALFGGIYGPAVVIVLLVGTGVQQGMASVLEAPFQFLGIMLVAALIGALTGALLGLVVGILVGLLISAITIGAFLPLHDAPRYLQVVRRWSTLVGGLGTLIATPLVALVLMGPATYKQGIGMMAMFSVIPALLAGLAIWRASGRIAAWYARAAGTAVVLAPR